MRERKVHFGSDSPACGLLWGARESSALDPDPRSTTCLACRRTRAWVEAGEGDSRGWPGEVLWPGLLFVAASCLLLGGRYGELALVASGTPGWWLYVLLVIPVVGVVLFPSRLSRRAGFSMARIGGALGLAGIGPFLAGAHIVPVWGGDEMFRGVLTFLIAAIGIMGVRVFQAVVQDLDLRFLNRLGKPGLRRGLWLAEGSFLVALFGSGGDCVVVSLFGAVAVVYALYCAWSAAPRSGGGSRGKVVCPVHGSGFSVFLRIAAKFSFLFCVFGVVLAARDAVFAFFILLSSMLFYPLSFFSSGMSEPEGLRRWFRGLTGGWRGVEDAVVAFIVLLLVMNTELAPAPGMVVPLSVVLGIACCLSVPGGDWREFASPVLLFLLAGGAVLSSGGGLFAAIFLSVVVMFLSSPFGLVVFERVSRAGAGVLSGLSGVRHA